MSDVSAQEDELFALTSIFDTSAICTKHGELNSGKFVGNITLPQAFLVTPACSDDATVEYPIQYLPPVTLTFILPHDYPSVSPPGYKITCPWLSESQILKSSQELDRLWLENVGMEILFTWTSFLQNDLLDFLDIRTPLVLGSAELPAVLEYDLDKRAKVFSSTVFTCLVCFKEKAGSACIQFNGCEHVYCRACMKAYFEMHICDGSIRSLSCPSEKCESEPNPAQVKALVSAELFERYDRLLLQLSLDLMTDVVYCPRKVCGSPLLVDLAGAMGSCPECGFVFCMFCQRTYHGLERCRFRPGKENETSDVGTEGDFRLIIEEYVSATDERKREIERRYGKKEILKIIEENESEDWIEKNSKRCPQCWTSIQKSDGCNKMVCTKCRAYFCWLCMTILSTKEPYEHFREFLSQCYNKLWET